MQPHDKLLQAISKHMGDFRLNEVALAHEIGREPYEVQARFLNTAMAYIYNHVKSYEHGLIRADLYEIIMACRDIFESGMNNYVEPGVEELSGTKYISI